MNEQAISREEFEKLLKASPKWEAILEEICTAAYSTLRVSDIDNETGSLSLSAVVCIRPQDKSSVRIFHLNFLIRSQDNGHSSIDQSGTADS